MEDRGPRGLYESTLPMMKVMNLILTITVWNGIHKVVYDHYAEVRARDGPIGSSFLPLPNARKE